MTRYIELYMNNLLLANIITTIVWPEHAFDNDCTNIMVIAAHKP